MLTILHTADVHLGAMLAKLGPKAQEQRIAIQQTFEKVVDLAVEKKVDLFIIAGDLFDANTPDQGLVDFVRVQLEKLNGRHIYTCISLGTHDFLTDDAIIQSLHAQDLPYIKIFLDPKEQKFVISDLATVVFCNVSLSNKTTQSPLAGIVRDDTYTYNIGIAHGSVQIPGKSSPNDSPISFDEIVQSKMDYIALGHWHNQQDVSQKGVSAWYAGSPELVALDQQNSGKVLFVTIDDQHVVHAESIQVGKRNWKEVKIRMDGVKNMEELLAQVKQYADVNTICTLVLEGMLSPGMSIDEQEIMLRLKDLFFYLQIKNDAQADDAALLQDIEGDIVKMKFVESVQNLAIAEDTKKEALRFGLILLSGKTKVY